MSVRLPQSRSLKDRMSKVPEWFRPKNQLMEAYARETLHGMDERRDNDRRRVAAAKASALPKAAEIVRQHNVRARSFLGGKTFPWAEGAWERVQMSRFRKQHPVRYLVWRVTGLMEPTF